MSDVWSDPSSTFILYVCEQRRIWRDCADAQKYLTKSIKGILLGTFDRVGQIFLLTVLKLSVIRFSGAW